MALAAAGHRSIQTEYEDLRALLAKGLAVLEDLQPGAAWSSDELMDTAQRYTELRSNRLFFDRIAREGVWLSSGDDKDELLAAFCSCRDEAASDFGGALPSFDQVRQLLDEGHTLVSSAQRLLRGHATLDDLQRQRLEATAAALARQRLAAALGFDASDDGQAFIIGEYTLRWDGPRLLLDPPRFCVSDLNAPDEAAQRRAFATVMVRLQAYGEMQEIAGAAGWAVDGADTRPVVYLRSGGACACFAMCPPRDYILLEATAIDPAEYNARSGRFADKFAWLTEQMKA